MLRIKQTKQNRRVANGSAGRVANDSEDSESKSISKGDFVSWDNSGGEAVGKVIEIKDDGELSGLKGSKKVEGTEDAPAAKVLVYKDGEPSEDHVGHKVKSLTKTKAPKKPESEKESRLRVRPVGVRAKGTPPAEPGTPRKANRRSTAADEANFRAKLFYGDAAETVFNLADELDEYYGDEPGVAAARDALNQAVAMLDSLAQSDRVAGGSRRNRTADFGYVPQSGDTIEVRATGDVHVALDVADNGSVNIGNNKWIHPTKYRVLDRDIPPDFDPDDVYRNPRNSATRTAEISDGERRLVGSVSTQARFVQASIMEAINEVNTWPSTGGLPDTDLGYAVGSLQSSLDLSIEELENCKRAAKPLYRYLPRNYRDSAMAGNRTAAPDMNAGDRVATPDGQYGVVVETGKGVRELFAGAAYVVVRLTQGGATSDETYALDQVRKARRSKKQADDSEEGSAADCLRAAKNQLPAWQVEWEKQRAYLGYWTNATNDMQLNEMDLSLYKVQENASSFLRQIDDKLTATASNGTTDDAYESLYTRTVERYKNDTTVDQTQIEDAVDKAYETGAGMSTSTGNAPEDLDGHVDVFLGKKTSRALSVIREWTREAGAFRCPAENCGGSLKRTAKVGFFRCNSNPDHVSEITV